MAGKRRGGCGGEGSEPRFEQQLMRPHVPFVALFAPRYRTKLPEGVTWLLAEKHQTIGGEYERVAES